MRADKFLAERYGSRTKAAEAIERGWVLVNGKIIRAKDEIKETDNVTFVETGDKFVSNGGYKLARGLECFDVSIADKVFVDLGASTGGFTDCLLQNGARRVYAVDVGESLLHEKLSGDERVVVIDNTNARYLSKEDFPEDIDGVVTDVSFISLRLIFPAVSAIIGENGFALVLIKPQFECENKHIGKSGIVQTSAHAEIVKRVLAYAKNDGLYPCGIVNAPVRKGKNIEYIAYFRKDEKQALSEYRILQEIESLVKKNSEGNLS